MSGLTSEQVRAQAFVTGASMSWVELLRSKEVAQQVADRVWGQLQQGPYGKGERQHVVYVESSATWPGTWRVTVFLPGVELSPLVRGAKAINQAARQAGIDALRASYSPKDLVKRYRQSR